MTYKKIIVSLLGLVLLAGCDLAEKCNKLYSLNSQDSISCQQDCSKHFPESLYSNRTIQACNAGQYLFISNIERTTENKIPIDSKYLKVLKEHSYRGCFDSLESKGQKYVEACFRGVSIEALRFSQILNKGEVRTGDRETGN